MSGKSNAAEKPEAAPAAEVKKGGLPPAMVKLVVIGGLVVVLATAALFVVMFVIAPKLRAAGPVPAETVAGEHGDASHGDGHEAEEGKGGHGEKGAHAAHGEILALGDIVVNPAGTNGRRYLKAAVSVEVKNAKLAKLIEHRSAPIKDLLVRTLSSRTLEELIDPTTKEEIREELIGEIDGLFEEGTILNVFFTEYVVQ